MTVSATTTLSRQSCNGTTTSFYFNFKIFAASDLVLTLIDGSGNLYSFTNQANASLGLSYTVNNVDVDSGCYVTFNSPPTSGWTLDGRTQVAQTQSTSVKNQGSFLPELHEEAFDRATRQIQDLTRLTYTYGIHGPDNELTAWPALPAKAYRANTVLAFDSNGLPTVGIPTTSVISSATVGAVLYPRTAAEIAASVTPSNFIYPPGDLRRYGCVIDGTTDNTVNVQAALNSNSSVFHPGGTCIVSQINLASNQTLYGAGPASIFKQKASQAQFTYVINVLTQTQVTIRDLTVDGNGNNQPSGEHNHGIRIGDSTDVTVRNCTVHDCNGDAIYWSSTASTLLCQRITIVNNTVYNFGRQGICCSNWGAQKSIVSGNTLRLGTLVTTSTSRGNAIHFELDTSSYGANYVGDIVVSNNVCGDTGISFAGPWSDVTIVGNTIRANTNNSGSIQSAIGFNGINNCTIVGNTIIGDNSTVIAGIQLQDSGGLGSATDKNVAIIGNTISQVAGPGITVFGTSSGVPSIGRVTITGNVVDTVGTGQTKNGIEVLSAFKETSITNNVIKTTTNLGIVIQGCPNFSVTGNRVAECSGSYGIYIDIAGSVGSGPGLVSHNYVGWATPAGKTGVAVTSNALNTRISVNNNDLGDTATPISLGASALYCSSWGNVGGNASLTGSFTMAVASTKVVSNVNVTAASRIILNPTNASAATLMGANTSLYVSARTAGTSFTVATANGGNAAGTETFDYFISV